MAYQFNFEKLEVWKKAKELSVAIYKTTREFPKDEIYGLTNQLRRSGVSVASNLAEGASRSSRKEQARFTEIAFGSLMEMMNQLMIANELEYLNDEELLNFRVKIEEVAKMLNALSSYQKR